MRSLASEYIKCGFCHEWKLDNGIADCEAGRISKAQALSYVRQIWETVTGGVDEWDTREDILNRRNIASQITLKGGKLSDDYLNRKIR